MRSTFFVAALVGTAAAYPGNAMKNLVNAVAKRQSWEGSSRLWGEWKSGGKMGDYGNTIKEILQGGGSGISSEGYKAPPMDSDECEKDKCCIWKYISSELYEMMVDGNGCNDFARSAIRMGFHDAAAWDVDSSFGGADGSLLIAPGELSRRENGGGMVDQAPKMKAVYEKYKGYGIAMADLIQCGAKVGALACPGGPRIRMFIGRTDDDTPAPENKLPNPLGEADELIELFEKKTVSPAGLIALLGAHTASKNHVIFIGPLGPQDLTPGKWDTEYFTETLKANASEGVTRFPSDTNLAADSKTKPSFELFEKNKKLWNEAYAKEYIRMSLFGVKNIYNLMECTKAMPKGNVKDDDHHGGHSTYPTSTKTKDDGHHGGHSTYPTSTKDDGHHGGHPTKKPHKPTYTTSTIYSKSTITIYSCPPEVKNCPYNSKNPHVTYTEYPVSTTVCEVTYTDEAEYPEATYPASDDSVYPVGESSAYYPVVSADYSAAAPEYPSASGSSYPTTTKAAPVIAGAGRTAGGFLAAVAGVVVAALM